LRNSSRTFTFALNSFIIFINAITEGEIAMNRFQRVLILVCVSASLTMSAFALKGNPAGRAKGPYKLFKTMTNDVYVPILINNVFNYYQNNGSGSFNVFRGDNEGFEFPQGSGNTVLYEDGIVWGGKQNGMYKVGGGTYWQGLQAGPIITPGTSPVPDNPASTANRIYRVRTDVNPSTPFDSAMQALLTSSESLLMKYQGFTAQQIYNQYITDWNNWPAAEGAPYTDVNNNGVYDANIDIPGFPGADQTLWYVANDLDVGRVYTFSGSQPLGLEVQKTIWAYKQYGALGNTIFTRTRLINKSGYSIDSMYVGQWADPDLGGAGDDLVGCDSLRSLGYAYNGSNNDAEYGATTPSIGFMLLYGPSVPSVPTDSAFIGGVLVSGKRNLAMKSFVPFIQGLGDNFADPFNGIPSATAQWLDVLEGFSSLDSVFINSTTGRTSSYVYSGDPVGGTGWLDSSPGDSRLVNSTGPFSMAVGDTQDVVIASVAGQGTNRLSSVNELKRNSDQARFFANSFFKGPTIGVAPVSGLNPTGTTVHLQGSLLNQTGLSVTTQWVVLQKPVGSSVAIIVVGPTEATLIPDLGGTYKIGYQAKVGSSVVDEADVQFQATTVQQPVVSIVVHSGGSIGDTVYCDGSASSDPQSLPLTYQWSVSGGDVFDLVTHYDSLRTTMLDSTRNKSVFVARRAGTYTITLSVSDSVWTVTRQLSVIIGPIQSGSQVIASVNSSAQFPPGGYYGFGPMRADNTGTLWADINGNFFPINFADPVHPLQNYLLNQFGNYAVNNDTVYTAAGTQGVNIYATDGNSHVTGHSGIPPQGWGHPVSADTSVTDVFTTGHYLFFSGGLLGMYVYDISNPLTPLFVTEFTNNQYWGNFTSDGSTLVGVNPRTSIMTALSINFIGGLSQIGQAALPHPYTNVRYSGSYYFFFKSDTIGIYRLTTFPSFSLTLQTEIPVPRTLDPLNSITDIAAEGSTLLVATSDGLYFYDLTNPTVATLSGEFLTGTRYTRVYMGGGYTLALNNGRGVAEPGSYEGLNMFSQFVTTGWFVQDSPAKAVGINLTGVSFSDTRTGTVVGALGTIMHTTNGGGTWVSQSSGTTQNLGGVSFTDANTGTAVGDSGIILQTINGGTMWSMQSSGTIYNLYRVSFSDANNGTAVGQLGTILHTTNGGTTWAKQTSGTTSFLRAVSFTDTNNGTVVGDNGTILRTTNGGGTWTSQTSGTTGTLYGVSFTDAHNGTAVGTGGILRTVDGGVTWMSQTLPYYGFLGFQDVCFTDSINGTVVGSGILRTTDAGSTWTQQTSAATALSGVSFVNANSGTAVGYGGTILRTVNGGSMTSVKKGAALIPTTSSLAQNYPNPFNPSTTIRFSLAQQGRVSLKIFDLLGRELVTLVNNQERIAGNYSETWNASSFASGVYFYRLQAGSFVQTKKLMLLK
jgi:photosystem II stability/assembly factor-like uncharacterized protein